MCGKSGTTAKSQIAAFEPFVASKYFKFCSHFRMTFHDQGCGDMEVSRK